MRSIKKASGGIAARQKRCTTELIPFNMGIQMTQTNILAVKQENSKPVSIGYSISEAEATNLRAPVRSYIRPEVIAQARVVMALLTLSFN